MANQRPCNVSSGTSFLSLPPECRTIIYDLLFDDTSAYTSAFEHRTAAKELAPDYRASDYLRPLLTCRTFYNEAHLLAFSRVFFVVHNPYTCLNIKNHMTGVLRPSQISSIRHLAIVADARHFRQLRHWRKHAFGIDGLALSRLSIVLHRSSYWHYLFDFNSALVTVLRNLESVEELIFVNNSARVKGTMLTWYNRLVKLILETDCKGRYAALPDLEKTWWDWNYCPKSQSVSLGRQPARLAEMAKEMYDKEMAPLWDAMVLSMRDEEYDPDPFSRVSA